MATVLIVEDDKNMQLLTTARLKNEYSVLCADDGVQALDIIHNQNVDIIVADIMMPEMDGYTLLKTIRSEGYTTPYLMLTAKQSIDDKRMGFSLGTDDYMTKPFSSDELHWRIEALLRRANISSDKKITIGSTTVDSLNYTVSYPGKSLELPKKEFELLFKLLSYPDMIFTKPQLLDSIWGLDSESGEDTVKTHISRIRNKLKDITDFDIITIKGLGYKAEIRKDL